MKVNIKRIRPPFVLEARNETGNTIIMDGSIASGGEEAGFRPMQLLLAGIGGCSTIDLVAILQKQRQNLKDLKIEVTGDRDPDAEPSPFTAIHLHYILIGDIEDGKAGKAVDLAVNKYCSVGLMLGKSAAITYDYEIRKE